MAVSLEPRAPQHYTRSAVAMHWVMVVLILTALSFGWVMTSMAVSPLKLRMYSWHKWIGVTILALVVVRLCWRLRFSPPDPVPMPAWQRIASGISHCVLYLMMLVQPLTGWLFSNASGYPIVFLKLVPLPNLVAKDKLLAARFEILHGLGSAILTATILVHALAALRHHFIDRDDTLRRMLTWHTR